MTRPLVPVIADQKLTEVTLESALLDAPSLRLNPSNPLIEIAFLRFLIAIVQHALRPSIADVRRFILKGFPSLELKRYIERYGFGIFDKTRPLLQIRRLKGDSPWYRLVPGRNGASSTTVTDHTLYDTVKPIRHIDLFSNLLMRLSFASDTGNSTNGYMSHGALVKQMVLFNRETSLLRAICAHLPAPDLPPIWTLGIPSLSALNQVSPDSVSPYAQLSRAVRLKRNGHIAYAKGMAKHEGDPMVVPLIKSFSSHKRYQMLETLASCKTKVPPFFDSPTPQPVMVYLDVNRALQNTVHQVALPTYDRLELRRLVQTSERTMRNAWHKWKADRS